jgi:hypothetical protein
MGAYLALK